MTSAYPGGATPRNPRWPKAAFLRHAAFDPGRARVLLRPARAAFPPVRGWTEQFVDAAYDPRTRLLAAIHGEPQRRAAWP